MSQRTIIVGGGAIGLSIAWELSQRDFDVTLLDRAEVGKATSWAAAGILPPANLQTATDPIDQLRGFSHQLFPDWIARLQDLSGIDTGFDRCGGWYLAKTPGERASMIGMVDYWKDLDIDCERVDPSDLIQRESSLAELKIYHHAYWVPDEYRIRSPGYLEALADCCRKEGVHLMQRSVVEDIQSHPDSVTIKAIAADEGAVTLNSDSVIVCAGTWTGKVAPMLRLQSSLVPIRGQILLLKAKPGLLKAIVNVGNRYLVPRKDGHVLVGSCEEEVGLKLGTTTRMLESLREFANETCPQLADAEQVHAWSGLRPMTFDGFPMIGKVPDTSNVYVASGHYRSGVHLSPGTAKCLANLMCGEDPPVDLSAFRVGKQQT